MNSRRIMSAILAGVLSVFCLSAAANEDREDKNDREARHHRDASPALIQARQKFFGLENVDDRGRVDKDKVIFSWATNTTYAVSVLGRVLLLDSYINRPELPTAPIDKRRTPILPQDFVDLRPEAILLGHGHGDHADNAAFLAGTLNIAIFSSPETCDVMQLDAARIFGPGRTVNCIGAGSGGSNPGAEVNRLNILEPVACVTVFKHVHSASV